MKTTKLIIPLAIALIAFFVIPVRCTRIDSGHEGILIKLYGTEKGVQDVSLVSGRVWYNPWTEDVEQYQTFVQTVDYDAFDINAKDGSSFSVDPTLSFYIVAGNSPRIFQKYRKELSEIQQTTMLNYVKDAFRLQMNKYTTDEIVSNREKFEADVQRSLSEVLDKEGFHLEQLTSGLKYPQTIVDAVNSKNKAVQDALRIDNEVKSTEATARKRVAEAEGSAQAKKIEADADAYVYQQKQRSLTPLLIQQQFIEKWNGELPTYGQVPTIFKNVQ